VRTAVRNLLFAAAGAVGVALLLVGVTTPAGHGITAPIGDAGTAVWRVLADNVPDLTSLRRLAAGPAGAVLAGLALFAAAVVLIPWCRTSRGIAVTAVAGAVLTLYVGGGFS
jgi:hypothetical protein